MNTLAEIEAAVENLTMEELAKLDRVIREKRSVKPKTGHSIFDIKPSDLGRMSAPLGSREDWYDEMLESRV